MIRVNNSIELKDLELSDAPDLFNIIDTQREYIGRWTNMIDYATDLNEMQKFIESTRETDNKLKLILFDGNKVGLIGTRNMNLENKATEINYWIDKNHTDKGIELLSIEALINKLHELGINQFDIHAITLNARSCLVAEELGFEIIETKYNAENVHGNKFDLYIYRKTFNN